LHEFIKELKFTTGVFKNNTPTGRKILHATLKGEKV